MEIRDRKPAEVPQRREKENALPNSEKPKVETTDQAKTSSKNDVESKVNVIHKYLIQHMSAVQCRLKPEKQFHVHNLWKKSKMNTFYDFNLENVYNRGSRIRTVQEYIQNLL